VTKTLFHFLQPRSTKNQTELLFYLQGNHGHKDQEVSCVKFFSSFFLAIVKLNKIFKGLFLCSWRSLWSSSQWLLKECLKEGKKKTSEDVLRGEIIVYFKS